MPTPLPPPVGGGFSFYSLLPGVTLRSPPAVFWSPLQGLSALRARRRRDKRTSTTTRTSRTREKGTKGTRTFAILRRSRPFLLLIGVKRPALSRGAGAAQAPAGRKGGIAGHEVPLRPRCAIFARLRSLTLAMLADSASSSPLAETAKNPYIHGKRNRASIQAPSKAVELGVEKHCNCSSKALQLMVKSTAIDGQKHCFCRGNPTAIEMHPTVGL